MFLSNNYEREAASSQYLKLAPNTSATIRIVSRAVEGYQVFMDGKPVRWSKDGEMPKKAYSADDKVKPFAAFTVWHKEDTAFKIYSCTTRSVLQEIANLCEVEGEPMTYDLKVTRKGAGLDTKYYVRVDNKEPFDKDLCELAVKFNEKIEMDQLFVEGGNPFKPVEVAA
jgi:alpha-acetolactate decarboxylase